MTTLHLLRPYWLWGLLLLPLLSVLWRRFSSQQAWHQLCDSHLLTHLISHQQNTRYSRALAMLTILILMLILSLTGPAYTRLPVPLYQKQQAHVLLLDTSNTMLARDLSPNRLQRAKFKLHDLLHQQDKGQFALIAYTGEPFVVSPLTDDGQTIDALLPSLTSEIMPVGGNRLDLALLEAQTLLEQSNITSARVLVLTAEPPSASAISTAHQLAKNHLSVSILPMLPAQQISPAFQQLASSGHGELLLLSLTSTDIEQWLKTTTPDHTLQTNNKAATWRDDGRWLLIPALLLLLPMFRRNWLQRIKP
jgi:Ca-activated chloride channel family protein